MGDAEGTAGIGSEDGDSSAAEVDDDAVGDDEADAIGEDADAIGEDDADAAGEDDGDDSGIGEEDADATGIGDREGNGVTGVPQSTSLTMVLRTSEQATTSPTWFAPETLSACQAPRSTNEQHLAPARSHSHDGWQAVRVQVCAGFSLTGVHSPFAAFGLQLSKTAQVSASAGRRASDTYTTSVSDITVACVSPLPSL
jgi:hypothetical protein